jgi:alkanesulfonate monooxygenase
MNIVPGGDPAELAAEGVFLNHDARYENADEYLTIWKHLMQGETVDFAGKHIRGVQTPHPPLFLTGPCPAAHDLAAKHVDAYLTWGAPPAAVAEKIADIRARAAKHGRTLRFGVRPQVIVRKTNAEAWADTDSLISKLTDAEINASPANFAKMDSLKQSRITALHGGQRDRLQVSPNLRASVGLVRRSAGTALVADAATVAERLREYADLGVDTFVLSGYPHLEEAIRFPELVFPLIDKAPVPTRCTQTGAVFDIRATTKAAS